MHKKKVQRELPAPLSKKMQGKLDVSDLKAGTHQTYF